MKRGELIGRIKRQAKISKVGWHTDHEGANHIVYRLGATMIPIPRHREIGPGVTEAIFKECEAELGERWWK